jgi:hypothetical protein
MASMAWYGTLRHITSRAVGKPAALRFLQRPAALGPEKMMIELFAVVADDNENQATLDAEVCVIARR